jgi:hypothetical protein
MAIRLCRPASARGHGAHAPAYLPDHDQSMLLLSARHYPARLGAPRRRADRIRVLPRAPQVKITDEKYLRSHPELRWLVDKFVEAALLEQPTDVEAFAREFFTKPEHKQNYLDSGPVGTGN